MGVFKGMTKGFTNAVGFTKKEPSFFMHQENWNSFKNSIRISHGENDVTEFLKKDIKNISRNDMFKNAFSSFESYSEQFAPGLKKDVNAIRKHNPEWESLNIPNKYKIYKESFTDTSKYGFVKFILNQARRDIQYAIERRGIKTTEPLKIEVKVFDGNSNKWKNFNSVSEGKKLSNAFNKASRETRNKAEKNLEKERKNREKQERIAKQKEENQKRNDEQARKIALSAKTPTGSKKTIQLIFLQRQPRVQRMEPICGNGILSF